MMINAEHVNDVCIAAMHSFLEHCGELVTKGVTRRLLAPLEAAQVMLSKYDSYLRYSYFITWLMSDMLFFCLAKQFGVNPAMVV